VHPLLTWLRLIALVPLFFFGEFSLFCAAQAVSRFATDMGPGLMFAGLALASTLAYPLLVDFERRIVLQTQAADGALPLLAYDLFFVGGEFFAAWQLGGRGLAAIPLIGLALVMWMIAGAVARRRLASLQTGTSPGPSKKKRDGTARSNRPRRTRSPDR
jgi:hypothetical protein